MKVLIVVDMLNDFIDEEGVLSLKDAGFEIIEPIAEKIQQARENGDAIVYLCDAHETDDVEFNRFPAHAVRDTWGSEIITELYPFQGDYVIDKQRYSGFFQTDLEAILEKLAPEEVEVVGCCTSICVAGTVEELVNRDYKVVVDRTAVADFNPDAHKFFLDYQLPNIFGVTVK
jgi:nicotinamidase-related amidase